MTLGRPIQSFLSADLETRGPGSPIIDLSKGAMWGALPDFKSWTNNAPYTQQHAVCRLIRAPGIFSHIDDGPIFLEWLKSLIEEKYKVMEGLPLGYEASFDERELNGSGDMIATLTDMKKVGINPSYTWDELQGSAISLYWREFMRLFGKDPQTKKAGIVDYVDLPDLLPDMNTFGCIVYDTDQTNRFVKSAILLENMFPENSGDALELSSRKSAEMEAKEVNINFKGWYLETHEVREQAQALHDATRLLAIDPNRARMGIEGVEADIAAIASGYKETLEQAGQ